MPGWDDGTKEITRRFATRGYVAICPHLHYREGPDASPDDAAMSGSGKGPHGWFQLSHATVYMDHPYFTALEHTFKIDFINQAAGPSARVAVELSPESARELVARIQSVLEVADESARLPTSPRGE
jgi:hypothetical protein